MTPRIPQARISQHDARPETSWYAGRRIRMWCGLTRARRVGVAVLLLALLGPCACGADEAQLTVLTNGLRVLTQEVHSAPVVSVYMWYRAGSRDEHTGITGISHFVEHMMFKGTARFGPGEISRLVTRTGGWDNGYTWLDYTAYVETLPAKHLDLALRIEADRMANAAFAAKDVDSERTVVLSELEGHENDPGFHLSNEVRAAAFTAHPYQWPIIGWKSDVAAYDRDKAAAYYRAHYAPNNATLVVVGDFNRDDVLRRVRSLFGRIPRGSAVRDGVTEEPPQRGERRVVVRRPGGAGMIQMAFHVPAANHPDHYALDIAETVLGTGRTSRLYQALVAKQLAVNADAYNFTNRDPTLFAVYVTLAPGADHVDAEQAVLAEIDRLSSELISERELQRAKNQAKAAFVYGTDSVSKLANMLGFFDVIGNYRLLYDYVDRIEGVTREQVQEAARRYLDADNRTVGWFVPTDEGPAGRPSGPGPLMRSGGIPRASVAAAGGNRREGEPSSGAATATAERPANVGRREPTRIDLDNGATFIVYENPVVPAISIEGMVGGGMIFDPADKPGLSTFTAQMLSRGAAGRSYQEIADDLEFAAATIGVGGGIQVGNISGRCLKDDLPLVMRTLADQVRRPDFPEDQIALVRSQLEVAL
ncbi:MAG: insulinase family protein, partial [Armatimonadota bacterium]